MKDTPFTPPSLDSLSAKYCFSVDRVSDIASFIHRLARDSNADGPLLASISSEQTSCLLRRWQLAGAFATLCCLPRKSAACLRVLLCPGCGLPGEGLLIEVTAEFGKVERTLVEWRCGFTGYEFMVFEPSVVLKNSPDPIKAKVIAHLDADGMATPSVAADSHTGPLAVIRNPRTEKQWRERFIGDRWFESDILPQDRLADPFDLKAWLKAAGFAG